VYQKRLCDVNELKEYLVEVRSDLRQTIITGVDNDSNFPGFMFRY